MVIYWVSTSTVCVCASCHGYRVVVVSLLERLWNSVPFQKRVTAGAWVCSTLTRILFSWNGVNGIFLGIGTLWTTLGVAGSRDQACPYTGARATAEYNAISRCRTIPTEQDGGDGTRCSHFDEECLDRELMSGFVDTGVTNFLSRISIATLEDMGYQVDYSSADPFRASNLGPGCACRRRSLRGNDDDYDEYNKVSGDTASVSTGRKQFNNSTATTRTDRRRRTNTRHHRQLSDEMLQYAIEQGKEYLQAQPSLPDATMEKLKKDSGILYEGDQYVTVWVRDTNDLIFDVQVYRDD